MIDLVKLTLKAGNGGNGRVSFRREKYVPKGGPDGGNGGDGGSIILRATKRVNTLQQFVGAKRFKAEDGMPGDKRKKSGHQGEDLILDVPVGTVVWLVAENEASQNRRNHQKKEGDSSQVAREKYFLEKEGQLIPEPEPDQIEPLFESGSNLVNEQFSLKNIDLRAIEKQEIVSLDEDGQEVIICQGGKGGRGNEAFKSPSNTTPLEAEYGTQGEAKVVFLELRLLADIGLVGFPNAGKSTLLSVLTNARPEVAAYPFTTLQPQLGVMSFKFDDQSDGKSDMVLADIPGLIEAAHEGKGLGFDFLRHIEACRGLLYVLSLDEALVFDQQKNEEQKASELIQQYQTLKEELTTYSLLLKEKPSIIGVNKNDLYSEKLREEIDRVITAEIGQKPLLFSAATKDGLDKLRTSLMSLV